MKLSEFFETEGVKPDAFQRRLRVARHTVKRWLTGERLPAPNMMLKIYHATGAKVAPNDWFDLAGASKRSRSHA